MSTASQDALSHYRSLTDAELVEAYACALSVYRSTRGPDRMKDYEVCLRLGQVARERGRGELLEEGARRADKKAGK